MNYYMLVEAKCCLFDICFFSISHYLGDTLYCKKQPKTIVIAFNARMSYLLICYCNSWYRNNYVEIKKRSKELIKKKQRTNTKIKQRTDSDTKNLSKESKE